MFCDPDTKVKSQNYSRLLVMYFDYRKQGIIIVIIARILKNNLLWKQGRLEPVETYVKNNKRGLGADKVKKKVLKVKPDRSDSSKGSSEQVIFS